MSFTLFDQNVLMLLYIYSDGAAKAQRDLDSVHRVMGPGVHESGPPSALSCRRSGAFQPHLGASLAIWDGLMGSLRIRSAESPRLVFGVTGHSLAHGLSGLWPTSGECGQSTSRIVLLRLPARANRHREDPGDRESLILPFITGSLRIRS